MRHHDRTLAVKVALNPNTTIDYEVKGKEMAFESMWKRWQPAFFPFPIMFATSANTSFLLSYIQFVICKGLSW